MYPTHSRLACAAALALTPFATAQSSEDYNFNFANMMDGAIMTISGPSLFGSLTGSSTTSRAGNSIRTCYGIDSFQGGRHQSNGQVNITHLSWIQSGSVQFSTGLSSVLAQSVDSLDGDACFSSLFNQGLDTQTGMPVTLRSSIGGTFPPIDVDFSSVFVNVFLEVSGSNGIGFTLPTTLGTDSNGFPLLPHVIFEVQGPANQGNTQYYVASFDEQLGTGTGGSGTGGVTNGNGRMGQSLFGPGATADLTGTISHNRITAFSPSTGLVGGIVPFSDPSTMALSGYALASDVPFGWVVKDGRTGGGAPDWNVSTSISTINLRTLDVRAGAEGDTLYSSLFGLTPLGTSIDNPALLFNAPFYIWSATPASLMLQQPMSWDTTLGFASPGSQAFPPQLTTRAGLQNIPVNVDALTMAFLNISSLSVGTTYTPAADIDADGGFSVFDFGQGLGLDGESTLPAALPIVSSLRPALAGTKLGIASAGVQFDGVLRITEFSTACTVVLQ